MTGHNPGDDPFNRLAAEEQLEDPTLRAPSRLRSKTYSALILRQQETAPLCSLPESHARGYSLCVFEELVRIAPTGESLKERNPCRVCHARVLAERIEGAPIYWPGCPYVAFQKPSE